MISVSDWLKNKWVIAISIIWVIIGFALLFGYWAFTWRGWDWQALNWQVLTGFATWILAGGIGVAIWQIIVTRKNTTEQLEAERRNTQAQIAMDWFRELRDEKTLKQLRSIIYRLPDNFTKPANDDQEEIIEHLISRFNFLGVLVEKGLIDKKLAVDAYNGTTSLKCWYQLHQYIKKIRDDRGHFGVYFEGYTRLCLDHFEGSSIEVKFYKGKKEPSINLVTKLQEKDLFPRSFDEIKKT